MGHCELQRMCHLDQGGGEGAWKLAFAIAGLDFGCQMRTEVLVGLEEFQLVVLIHIAVKKGLGAFHDDQFPEGRGLNPADRSSTIAHIMNECRPLLPTGRALIFPAGNAYPTTSNRAENSIAEGVACSGSNCRSWLRVQSACSVSFFERESLQAKFVSSAPLRKGCAHQLQMQQGRAKKRCIRDQMIVRHRRQI